MSKRVRITAIVATLCVCLSLFVVGVLSATTATLNVTSTLRFEADGVYVMVDGKLKQGTAVDASDLTTSSTYTGYSYSRIGGSGTDQHAPDGSASSSTFLQADGTTPAGDWAIGEITFTSTNKVVIYEFTVNNYSGFEVQATITTNIAEELSDEIANNQLTLDTYKDDIKDTSPSFTFDIPARTSVTTPGSTTYKIVVTLTNFMSSILTNEISMNFKFEEKLDVALSGSQYSGATHAVLAPTGSGSFTGGTTITDSSSTVNWDSLEANLTTTERAVKYRMEVTNNTEAGIKGVGEFTITGQSKPTPTTAGGVNTYEFTNYTVTEYAQYIQNIQPNDTQVYELVVELNQSADNATINVSISFDFTDDKMYQIEWEGNTYNYVNMGKYPQRYVGNTMNTELEALLQANDPALKETTKVYTTFDDCNLPTSTSAKDATPILVKSKQYTYIDGNTYARMETPDFNSTTYTYMNGETVTSGQAAWFKVEPIQWRVLTNNYNSTGSAMLLSELALSANTSFYPVYDTSYGDINNYARSDNAIRNYLTTYFYNQALTSEEQAKVTGRNFTEGELENKGVDETDIISALSDQKVWLPTRADYINSGYGFATSTSTSDDARLCSPSDFALANYSYLYTSGSYTTPARQNGGIVQYWTSSAASASDSAYYVYYSGLVSSRTVSYVDNAARPALLFNLAG